MVIEHIEGNYTIRSSFKFNKDGLVIVNSSKITNPSNTDYTEGEQIGMDIHSESMNLTHDETKQLANFIVKYYKGDKS